MELHFKISFEDIVELHKNIIANSNHHKKLRWMIFVVFTLYLMYILESISVFSVIVTLVWLIFYSSIFNYLALIATKRILKKQYNALLIGEHKLNINEDGITRKTETTNTVFKWSQFVNVRQDSSNYYLYVSDLQALLVPKEAFLDKEAEQDFNRYLKNMTGN
ncbi:YcxB family protein [Paenibacillus faecalis]|uniref:YcxB family protein n=1 Tax=Paenibacillus faecalis TaxID=2079532 RepID=UPI000D0F1D4C|nr:YcxB family protein [Paenibacillus faecalis]